MVIIPIDRMVKYLRSMKFGLMLLGALIMVSILGTVIPQGLSPEQYHQMYPPAIAKNVISIKLNDVFHSIYFAVIAGALCVNLLLCSVRRLKLQADKILNPSHGSQLSKFYEYKVNLLYDCRDKAREILQGLGFRKIEESHDKEGGMRFYARANTIGYLGTWLIHVGILIIILFLAYGQYTFFSTSAYGVPGDIYKIPEMEESIRFKDFKIIYKESGAVDQYISDVELMDRKGNVLKEGRIRVNNPLRYNGFSFYQNSTGWAANCIVKKDGGTIGMQRLYEGMGYEADPGLFAVQLTRVYSDPTGDGRNVSSQKDKGPQLLYSVFYRGKRVFMDYAYAEDGIEWNEYTFFFNNPRPYTYIQINKTKGQAGAAIGSALLMVGLILSFYIRPREAVVIVNSETLCAYINPEIKKLTDNGYIATVSHMYNK